MADEKETRMLSDSEVSDLLGTQSQEPGLRKIKILIVEDELVTRNMYDKGFFDQVFDKRIVASGKEALRVYADWQPDIALLDIFLPEITGYQMLKEIRTTLGDKKTTVIMATSLTGRDDVLSCIKLGADGYIAKPFQCGEIAAKVLSYYAKRDPDLAKKALVLCGEVARQSHLQSLLQKERPEARLEPVTRASAPPVEEAVEDKKTP